MFGDGAAEAATRLAENLNGNAIELMQEGFGRSTILTTPGGA